MEFRLAASDEQFATIAKLRAVRRLWARMLELSGAAEDHRTMVLHAVTSRPMMTKYDPWVNMLRTCVAAFAAGVGGADAVTVLPFDARLGLPDAFARRIARNTSSLLVEESHVAKVADPAGGAFAVEKLTDDLAVAGWEELGRIDAEAGVSPSSHFSASIARMRATCSGVWQRSTCSTVAGPQSRHSPTASSRTSSRRGDSGWWPVGRSRASAALLTTSISRSRAPRVCRRIAQAPRLRE